MRLSAAQRDQGPGPSTPVIQPPLFWVECCAWTYSVGKDLPEALAEALKCSRVLVYAPICSTSPFLLCF